MSGVASGQRLHFLPQRWMLVMRWVGEGGQQGGNFKGQDESAAGPGWVWTTACLSLRPAIWIKTGIKVSWKFSYRDCRPQTHNVETSYFNVSYILHPAVMSKLVFLLILLGSWSWSVSAGHLYKPCLV